MNNKKRTGKYLLTTIYYIFIALQYIKTWKISSVCLHLFPGSAKIHLKFHMQVLTHLFTYDLLTIYHWAEITAEQTHSRCLVDAESNLRRN